MSQNKSSQIQQYVKLTGINAVRQKLAYLSHWRTYESWNADPDLASKRSQQEDFLEACCKWWREKDKQGKLL